MPAAFVITATSPTRIGEALARLGISPSRIEAVYWGSRIPPCLKPISPPLVRLSSGPLSGALAVHAAAQALLSRSVGVTLAGGGHEALLLASPEAVGQLNLAPRAQVSGLALGLTPEGAFRSALKHASLSPALVECFIFAGLAPEHGAALMPAPFSGAAAYLEKPRLSPLIKTLERTKKTCGVVIAAIPSQACATLIERV